MGELEKAYIEIVDRNLLNGIQRDIYEILYCSGPMTSGEIALLYKDKYPGTPRNRNEIAKRVSDLVANGSVGKCEEQRRCPMTNKMISVWKLTGKIPQKPVPFVPIKERLERLEALEAALKEVRGPLSGALGSLGHMGITRQTPSYGKLKAFFDSYCS